MPRFRAAEPNWPGPEEPGTATSATGVASQKTFRAGIAIARSRPRTRAGPD